MFDNLRDSSFYEDDPADLNQEPEAVPPPVVVRRPRRRTGPRRLGMTAQQRFLLSFLFLITVCVMGTLALVVTGRMGLVVF